jgi:hypothetical protein
MARRRCIWVQRMVRAAHGAQEVHVGAAHGAREVHMGAVHGAWEVQVCAARGARKHMVRCTVYEVRCAIVGEWACGA